MDPHHAPRNHHGEHDEGDEHAQAHREHTRADTHCECSFAALTICVHVTQIIHCHHGRRDRADDDRPIHAVPVDMPAQHELRAKRGDRTEEHERGQLAELKYPYG